MKNLQKEILILQNFIKEQHQNFIKDLGPFGHKVLFNEFSQNVDINSLEGHLEIVQMFFEHLSGGISTEISTWTSMDDFSMNLRFSNN